MQKNEFDPYMRFIAQKIFEKTIVFNIFLPCQFLLKINIDQK